MTNETLTTEVARIKAFADQIEAVAADKQMSSELKSKMIDGFARDIAYLTELMKDYAWNLTHREVRS